MHQWNKLNALYMEEETTLQCKEEEKLMINV
jgi:hypothetical protein